MAEARQFGTFIYTWIMASIS